MVKIPDGYSWPPPPLIRKSSVDDAVLNPWIILVRAHDHVWKDYSAANLLIGKSLEVSLREKIGFVGDVH